MASNLWTIIATIVGGVIGIIGTLSAQFFSIMYEKEKNKQQTSRKVIEKKYNSFKECYKLYKYSFAQLINCNYGVIFSRNIINDKVNVINHMEDIYIKYMEDVSNLMELLEEDDYIAKQLTKYEQLKLLYIDIIGKRGKIFAEIFLWKNLSECNEMEIIKLDKEFIELDKKMDEQLKLLNNQIQELLYRNVAKNC